MTLTAQPYEERLAEHLQAFFGLANSTLRVWKHRNKIPLRYLRADYAPLPAATTKQCSLVKHIIQHDFINRAQFETVRKFKLRDLLREDKKHVRLQKEEAEAIITQTNNLRLRVKYLSQAQNPERLQELLALPIVHPSILIGNAKLYDKLRKGLVVNEADWLAIQARFLVVLQVLETRNK